MDTSSISTLSSLSSEMVDDVDMQNEPDSVSSEVSSTPRASSTNRSHRSGRPDSLSSQFIGYKFKDGGVEYTIQEKSAVHKGSKPLYIWRFDAQLKTTRQRHSSWLCNLCWDRGSTKVYSASNTTRPGRHLLDKHQINSSSELKETSDQLQISKSIAKSVL